MWVLETDKPEAFRLLGPLVSDDFSLHERRELHESLRQRIIIDIVTQITTEYTVVVFKKWTLRR